jgi:glycosyltransferase involved in cell wall biosynthesis
VRILKLCYEYPPIGGGGGQVVAALSKELVNLGHQVDLLTMGYRDLPGYEQVQGVNIFRVPSIRLKKSICHPHEMAAYMFGAFPRLMELTKHNPYDINHTHFIFPDAVLSLILKKRTGLPYIITAHGSDVPGYNPNRFKVLHRLMKPLWIKVVQGADTIVSPSKRLAALIARNMPSASITLIPNGINLDVSFSSVKKNTNILIVTRMFQRKGIQYFLRALEGTQHPHQVDIVGDGPYLPMLKSIAKNLNTNAKFTFHGWLDNDSIELKTLMANATLFIFPSESENFPIVLLEAMANQLAIITTRGTGCEEVVGDTALLVKPRDPAAILAALQTLIDNPDLRVQLGRAASQRVEKEFTWGAIAQRYVTLYNQSKHRRQNI